jgi:SAM-dependent methyltransferase
MTTSGRGVLEAFTVSLARRGVGGTLLLALKNVWWPLWDWMVPRRRQRVRENRAFDRRYGIDTYRIVQVADLGINSAAQASAHYYEPVWAGALERILAELPTAVDGFTFLDLGSGMGRAVFVALGFPFKRAIGVEISQKLHEAALENRRRYRNAERRCPTCEFHLGDATQFDWPAGPLVIFLCNPFGADPMQAIVAKAAAWLGSNPHDLYVIYYHPVYRALWEASGCCEIVGQGRMYTVYRGLRTPGRIRG